jgi:hypothetical protein
MSHYVNNYGNVWYDLLIIPLWFVGRHHTQPQNLSLLLDPWSEDEITYHGQSVHPSQYGQSGFHVREFRRESYLCSC